MTPISVPGSARLTDAEEAAVAEMLNQWAARLRGNKRRQDVYDQKNLFNDLRISTPPQLRDLEAVVGWGGKAVDSVGDRINFERFVSPGADDNPFGLDDIVADNDFRVEFSQATTSALIHSCSFITLSQGFDGEPDSLWLTRSAEQATGLWDRRARGLKAALTVSVGDDGLPERFFVYFPDKSVEIVPSSREFRATVMPNPTGRVPVEVMRFRPNLQRPFGQSRITPAVEYYIRGGVRTIVRSEVHAEFFAGPQRYGIGLDEDAFDVDKWSAITGRFLAVSRDEEGELPTVGQFQQHSMGPHTEHLRMWAAQMAGESSVPMDELGFPSDNPSSDSAIQAQRDPLRLVADDTIRTFQSALRRLAITTVLVRDGLTEVPDELRRVTAKFAPTFKLADSAAADAALKQASVLPWLAESPVFLEKMNYTPDEVDRLLSDKRKAQSGGVLDRILAGQTPDVSVEADTDAGGGVEPTSSDEANELKAKFDALGVAVRAGVDPADAANRLGLTGIKFTGAVPVALRMPEREAADLEER